MTEEDKEIIRRFRRVAAAAAVTLIIGMLFYHWIEKLGWIDALYFSVVSLLTVGYGDIAPETTFGKIFTIFYLIMGVAIMGALVNAIIVRAIVRREQKERKHLQKTKEK